MRVIVTKPENVRELEDDDIELINPKDVGYLTQTHIVPGPNGEPAVLLQVHWELKRTPAVAFHAPQELYWVELLGEFEDTEEDEEEVVDDVDDTLSDEEVLSN